MDPTFENTDLGDRMVAFLEQEYKVFAPVLDWDPVTPTARIRHTYGSVVAGVPGSSVFCNKRQCTAAMDKIGGDAAQLRRPGFCLGGARSTKNAKCVALASAVGLKPEKVWTKNARNFNFPSCRGNIQ